MFHYVHECYGHDSHHSASRRGRFGHGAGGFGRRGSPGDWFGDVFGPPPRADRGVVRYLVLDAIAQAPRHGYEVIQQIERRSRETYRPSPGIVYPTLQMLEELGHARLEEKDGEEKDGRKVYAITDLGTKDLAEHADDVRDFYDRSNEHDWESQLAAFGDLRRQAFLLLKTFKHAALRGQLTPDVQAKVLAVLRDALTQAEAILEGSSRQR